MQKSKLTSQTPINKSAKIYHISDKFIGFWPCLIKMLTSSAPSTLVSSSSINASIQRPLRSQLRMALFNTTTSAVREEAPSTWDWMHLTQFPSAVEQLSRSLFVVLNGCLRGKLEASKTLDLDLKSFKLQTDLLRIPSMRLSLPWDSHIDLELRSTKLLKQL